MSVPQGSALAEYDWDRHEMLADRLQEIDAYALGRTSRISAVRHEGRSVFLSQFDDATGIRRFANPYYEGLVETSVARVGDIAVHHLRLSVARAVETSSYLSILRRSSLQQHWADAVEQQYTKRADQLKDLRKAVRLVAPIYHDFDTMSHLRDTVWSGAIHALDFAIGQYQAVPSCFLAGPSGIMDGDDRERQAGFDAALISHQQNMMALLALEHAWVQTRMAEVALGQLSSIDHLDDQYRGAFYERMAVLDKIVNNTVVDAMVTLDDAGHLRRCACMTRQLQRPLI